MRWPVRRFFARAARPWAPPVEGLKRRDGTGPVVAGQELIKCDAERAGDRCAVLRPLAVPLLKHLVQIKHGC